MRVAGLAGRSCCAAIVLLAVMLGGCHSYPQVIEDPAVYKELDALYTAVTTKRRDLLDGCEGRLKELHSAGKLSDAGFAEVNEVIAEATSNSWSDAAQHLYDFMRAQRKRR